MRIAGIYKITSTSTGKVYIGESLNLNRRLCRHKTDLKYNNHSNIYLQRHFNKYGDLTFEIIEILPPNHALLLDREAYWINFNQANITGFNLSKGGIGGAGTLIKHKDFTLVRISDGFYKSFKTINDYEESTKKSGKHISEVLNGKRKINNGWTSPQNYLRLNEKRIKVKTPKKHPPLQCKNFSLINTITGEIYTGKGILSFSRERGVCYNSLLRVIRGERKIHKGWKTLSPPI